MIQAEAVTGVFENKSRCVQGQGGVRQFIAVCYETAVFITVVSSEKCRPSARTEDEGTVNLLKHWTSQEH